MKPRIVRMKNGFDFSEECKKSKKRRRQSLRCKIIGGIMMLSPIVLISANFIASVGISDALTIVSIAFLPPFLIVAGSFIFFHGGNH